MLCRVGHLSHTMHVLKKCHIVVSQPTWVSHIMPLKALPDLRGENVKVLTRLLAGMGLIYTKYSYCKTVNYNIQDMFTVLVGTVSVPNLAFNFST